MPESLDRTRRDEDLELPANHTDAYTDAKRAPRRTAPKVFGMSINIVFREYRTKVIGVGEVNLVLGHEVMVYFCNRPPHGTGATASARLMEI